MFKLLKTEGAARRGEFTCPHGTVQTPVFMNVGTQAAIKGALSAEDLEHIGTQVELSNTYHLHLRPGDEVVKKMGGLHKFMTWQGPILTDSGGFQVFSLAGLRKIKEEGVTFASHLDGHKIFMGPEESMRIQSNLGSDIAMAFDECVENPATYPYAKASCERTARWLARCKEALAKYNAEPDAVNPGQQLWGINQGATFKDLRVWHMQEIAKLDLPGYAIGGLAVGEPTEEMRRVYDTVLAAQLLGIEKAVVGASCRAVDAAARELIYNAGYEGCFGHSLGHSVGIEIHEMPGFSPSIAPETTAKEGMVITVEPGIYLEGRFGVRIEDMVWLAPDGTKDLTNSPKELIIL